MSPKVLLIYKRFLSLSPSIPPQAMMQMDSIIPSGEVKCKGRDKRLNTEGLHEMQGRAKIAADAACGAVIVKEGIPRNFVIARKEQRQQHRKRGGPVPTAHIYLDERGVAWIDDSNVKVIEVVLDKLAYGWSPEEIHFQHPSLSLAQIHAALSYYYDHQQAFDTAIERQCQEVEVMAAQAYDTPFRKRLRALGKLP